MTDPREVTAAADRPSPLASLAWLVPGIPLVWGVWQTLIKVAQLFQD